jgi:hypothetical protein
MTMKPGLSREAIKQLEENFAAFIAPFLDENNPADVHIDWEFRVFLHEKMLKVMTAENEQLKRMKQLFASR